MYRVNRKNEKEYRKVTTKAKYFVVISLFLLLLLVIVGSSSWNLHMKVFGFTKNATIVSGDKANSLLLKYVDYGTTNIIKYADQDYYAYTYDGAPHTPTITTRDDDARDFELSKFKYEYTCLYIPNDATNGEWKAVNSQTTSTTAPIDSGLYQVVTTYTDNTYSNYVGSVTLYFAIQPKAIDVSVSQNESVYGNPINPIEQTVTEGGLCGSDSVASLNSTFSLVSKVKTLSAAGEDQKLDAGEYDIVGTDNSRNYAITFKPKVVENGTYALYTITKRPITVKIVDQTSVYGDLPFDFTNLNDAAQLTANTLAYTDALSDVISVSSELTLLESAGTISSNAGIYAILGSNENPNYEVTFAGSFESTKGTYTITKAPLNMTAISFEITYGDAPTYSVTYSGFKNNETKNVIVGNPTFLCDYAQNKKNGSVGTYTIKPSLGEQTNYEINPIDGTLTVNKKALTLTLDSKSTYYGEATPSFTCTATGFVYNESFASYKSDFSLANYVTADYTVGDKINEYNIIWSKSKSEIDSILSNYDCTLVASTLTVNARPITVTIEDKSSVYGATPVALTATVAVTQGYTLTGNPIYEAENPYTLSTSVTNTSNVATYPIVGTSENTNYNITFKGSFENIKGTYSVTKKAITITWSNTSFTYDGNPHKPKATAGSLCNGDTCEVTVSGEETNAGNYTATAASVSNSNYSLPTTNLTASFTISPKTITIAWGNTAFTYDGTPHIPTATAGDLISGDICGITVSGEETDVGTYTATATDLSNSNYALPNENLEKIFTISPKGVTITWTNTTLTYSGTDQAPTATANGLVANDGSSVKVTGTGKDANTSSNTTFSATASIVKVEGENEVTDNNYTITSGETQTFTIEKAPLTITADSYTVMLGEEIPTYTATYNGLVNNEPTSVLDGTLSFEAPNSSNEVGTFDIVPSGLSSNNYAITYVNGVLAVSGGIEKPTDATDGSNIFAYDGNEKTYTPVGFDSNTMVISENSVTSATDAGSYTINVSPIGSELWMDGTSTELTFTWTITKKEVTVSWENTEFTYSGTEQSPTATIGGVIGNDDCTITVKGAVNAGTHTATATLSGEKCGNYSLPANATCEFVINKKEINITNKTIELDYSTDKRTWQSVEEYIRTQLVYGAKFGEDNVYINTGNLTNGIITYTLSGSTYAGKVEQSYGADMGLTDNYLKNQFVGSTYIGTSLSLGGENKDNYIITGNQVYFFKYKTASVSGAYYTIEDAIHDGTTSTISFPGNSSSATSYILTCFSKIELPNAETLSSNSTLNTFFANYKSKSHEISGRTLLVPFDSSETELKGEENKNAVVHYVYSALIIPSGINLSFKGGASLKVGAHISAPETKGTVNNTKYANNQSGVREHGVIVNDGSLTFEDGTSIYSYGYIKSSSIDSPGYIIAENGVQVREYMYIHSWPGGTAASGMYSKAFPTNAWSLHNISCTIQINAGAQYYAYAAVTASFIGYTKAEALIIGKQGDVNCIFIPDYDKANFNQNSFIVKSAKPAASWSSTSAEYKQLYSIAGANYLTGQKDIIKICGDYTDRTLSVDVGVELKTSTEISAPLGFMDVTIAKGASLILNNSDYVFLPGTKLIVESGATLVVGSNNNVEENVDPYVDLVFLDYKTLKSYGGSTFQFDNFCKDKVDAYAVVNGNIEIYGRIGGKITSTEAGATMVFHTMQEGAKYRLMKSHSEPRFIEGEKYKPKANVLGVADTVLKSGTYCTYKIDNAITWMATTGTIVFDQNYGENSIIKSMENTSMPYTLVVSDYPSNPTRELYILDVDENGYTQWYLDKECSLPIAPGSIVYEGTTLYAKWTAKPYKVNYQYVYGTNVTAADVGLDNPTDDLIITADSGIIINSLLSIDDIDKTVEGYTLTGWYVDIDCQTKVDKAFELLSNSVSLTENAIIVYGKWDVYVPSFKVEYSTGVGIAPDGMDYNTDIVLIESQESWQPSKNGATFDRDISVNYYFDGWYTDESCTTSFTGFSGINMNETQHLYAKWIEKNILSICISEGSVYETRRYKPGTTFTVPELPIAIESDQYAYWALDGATDKSQGDLVAGSQCTLVDSTKVELFILTGYEITTNLTNSSVIIYYSGHYSLDGVTVKYSTSYSVESTESQTPCFYAYTDGQITNVDVTWKYTNSQSLSVNGVNYTDNSKTPVKITAKTPIVASSSDGCLAEGTLITLADGTFKKVEDLEVTDVLLTFNHLTGKYEAIPLLSNSHAKIEKREHTVLTLRFTDGLDIRIVSNHGFFDKDLNEYVFIDLYNYNDYIGHKFVTSKLVNGEAVSGLVTLIDAFVTTEIIKIYCPVSIMNCNVVANGLLSLATGLTNLFEYDETMKYDEEKMKADIEKYGLYTYDDFKEYMPEEYFSVCPLKYFKPVVEKGEYDFNQILYLLSIFDDPTTVKPFGNSESNSSAENNNITNDRVPLEDDPTNTPFETTALPPPTTTSTSSGGGGENGNSNDDER